MTQTEKHKVDDIFKGRLLEVSAVARRLSVSASTVYRLIDEGELEAVRIRRSVRVPDLCLRRYMERAASRL